MGRVRRNGSACFIFVESTAARVIIAEGDCRLKFARVGAMFHT